MRNTGIKTAAVILYGAIILLGALSTFLLDDSMCSALSQIYSSALSNHTAPDFISLYKADAPIKLICVVILFIVGFSPIGAVLSFAVLAMRVFYLGFIMSTMIYLCPDGGFMLMVRCVFLQNVLSLPLLICYGAICASYGKSGMIMSQYIFRFAVFSALTALLAAVECLITSQFI